jgi:putative transposase
MPRIPRASVGGVCYHVINRGNGRQQVFHEDGDYEAFVKAIAHACIEVPMPVLAYCLMPNHFHLVVLPAADGDLSRWMHWLQNTHVRRYHQHYHGSGHIWQGRFKSFPIEQDEHLLAVLRYVERNPVRANLVRLAEQWAWSSARFWIKGAKGDGRPSFLASGPTPRPRDWLAWVNAAVTASELEALRRSVTRGSPYGGPRWMERIAADLGIQSTLRPRGRPRSKGAK